MVNSIIWGVRSLNWVMKFGRVESVEKGEGE